MECVAHRFPFGRAGSVDLEQEMVRTRCTHRRRGPDSSHHGFVALPIRADRRRRPGSERFAHPSLQGRRSRRLDRRPGNGDTARSRGPFVELAPADVQRVLQGTVFGAFLVAQQAASRRGAAQRAAIRSNTMGKWAGSTRKVTRGASKARTGCTGTMSKRCARSTATTTTGRTGRSTCRAIRTTAGVWTTAPMSRRTIPTSTRSAIWRWGGQKTKRVK